MQLIKNEECKDRNIWKKRDSRGKRKRIKWRNMSKSVRKLKEKDGIALEVLSNNVRNRDHEDVTYKE